MYKCLICGNKKFAERSYKIPFELIVEKTKVRICETCGFGIINPLINNELLNIYYESSKYYIDRREGHLISQLNPLPHPRALSQYDFFASHFNFKDINSVLDFGAGSATTLRTIKIRHEHIITTAIEISKCLGRLLEDCDDIDEVSDNLCNSNITMQDLIIASGVLEHLSNPIETIKIFQNLLYKGGYLFIEVPNCPYPLYYNCFGSFQPHIVFFTKASFIEISKKFDFEIIWLGGIGSDIKDRSKPEIVPKLRRTGLIQAVNKQGDTLRLLLRKKDKKV